MFYAFIWKRVFFNFSWYTGKIYFFTDPVVYRTWLIAWLKITFTGLDPSWWAECKFGAGLTIVLQNQVQWTAHRMETMQDGWHILTVHSICDMLSATCMSMMLDCSPNTIFFVSIIWIFWNLRSSPLYSN